MNSELISKLNDKKQELLNKPETKIADEISYIQKRNEELSRESNKMIFLNGRLPYSFSLNDINRVNTRFFDLLICLIYNIVR
jgi:hypothetical protein